MRRNKKISLLPHIRQNIYGFNPLCSQVIGWQIKKINIESQWKLTEGEDVKIAVIDTGCDLDHPDLKENLLPGKNFISLNNEPHDDNGHGTHVAGTIAAQNNGCGMVGVAPKAKIIPVKALNNKGNGNLNNLIDAIIWSADNKADFITMSLGSPNGCRELEEAIIYANTKKSIVFCAAGNSGENSDIMYPAKYKDTISIGAIDENFDRTKFTCSGEELDFLAPGSNIFSAVPDDTYAIMSGTSMSNPFAVGCAALLLSYNRKYKKYNLESKDDYINILKEFSIPIQNKKYQEKKYQGHGIINLNLI
jgi:major intracellular serine protease